MKNKNIIDLAGQKFNRWTVQEFAGTDNRHESLWLCRCDCGTQKVVRSSPLRLGTSKGCSFCRPPSHIAGCDYVVKGDIAYFKTSQNVDFFVSKTDAESVSGHTWCIAVDGYLVANIDGKTTKLHHLIMGTFTNAFVDHINGHKLDNRRENLRVASTSQNSCNAEIPSHNTSGYKGVCWNQARRKWQANIGYCGRAYHLGLFNTREQAALAYNEAAKELHREFACLNPIGETANYRVCKRMEGSACHTA